MNDQTLLLIALILILVDIFLPTDITTFIAYIIFSYLIAHNVDVPILYQIIIGISAWWVMVAIHYFIFRNIIRKFTDRFIAPTRMTSCISIHFGKKGQVLLIEDKWMIKVDDELYPFREQDGKPCQYGDQAIVVNYTDEKMIIQKIN